LSQAIYLAFANPASTQAEGEFNRWYDEVHVPDVLGIPGIVAATRYRQSPFQRQPYHGRHSYRYLAVYELDTEHLQDTLDDFEKLSKSGKVALTHAIDEGEPRPYGVTMDRLSGFALANSRVVRT
jgi:hypothetical protein